MYARVFAAILCLAPLAACATYQDSVESGPAFISGPIHTFSTDQGFTVVLARAEPAEDQASRAIIGLYTREGATTEPVPGYAHMGEHLYANSRYPLPSPDVPEGSRSLASNAQARPDYVSMWLMVNRPDGTDAAPIGVAARFASRAWWPDIDDALVEQERQRVIIELTRGLGSGRFLAQRGLEHAFYGARPGMSEEIRLTEAYDADHLRAYLARAYRPENLVLVVAGDIDPQHVEAELRAIFAERGAIPDNELADRFQIDLRPEAFVADSGPVLRTSQVAEGDWLAVGIPVAPQSDRERAALLVLDQLLLGGRKDFEELWEISRSTESPLGAALSASGPLDGFGDSRGYGAAIPPLAERDPAYLTIRIGADEMAFEDARRRVLEALTHVRRTSLTDDEMIRQSQRDLLEFYRRWFGARVLRPLSDHLAGLAMMEPGRTELVLRLHQDIAEVTPRDVRRAFDRYFLEDQMRWSYLDGVTPEPETAEE